MEDKKIRLFVYGTLKKGGSAAHYLKNEKLVRSGLAVKNFALYRDEIYPYMVPDMDGREVIGDLFEISEDRMPEIEFYEGPMYQKTWLEELQAFTFIKADEDLSGLKLVKKGEWKQ
jgi:gamma-glutamylcyclotransferase (GGCT)/AIG2-like uncharacterized protein YtfP